MKKFILILILLIITNSVTYIISSSSSNSVSLKEDYIRYLHMRSLIPATEEEVMTLFESVSDEKHQDDDILYTTLSEQILPKYTLYNQDVNIMSQSVNFKTEEVKALQDVYHRAVQSRLGGFQRLKASIEKQDEELKKQAIESFETSDEYMEKFHKLKNELHYKYGPG
ncbi:hypothetical protein [Chengkuizengella axinellae]|uniref:Inhibitor I9 domain-containing protein n=1 Tax=Chengkuizengella axinellae TaxID=3064388 RepID=A0ABT9J391_9BACL|nr:hypothetical protein [Chengkuizengella sp. 2205SS18-9]MDP5276091.1 hypothetical protein [Chengkuizengella sp. 2205SS18-9]